MSTSEHRTRVINGYRLLADLLEQHDEVPLPYDGNQGSITFQFLNGSEKECRAAMAAAARAFPCTLRKRVTENNGSAAYFYLDGELDGLKVDLVALRESVCERVVTGVEQVTEMVKDPDALAAVPEVEVTREVETVEWRCHPLLAPAEAQEVPA